MRRQKLKQWEMEQGKMKRRLMALALALTLGATLSACGRKGDPQRPPGQADAWPRGYPAGAPGANPDVFKTRPTGINN